jgi:2-dehydropantoate 2-reductase
VKCSVTDDLLLERWRKLVWNIPFNGLSILSGGIDTATILASEPLRDVTLSLMAEVVTAANACGHALPNEAIQEQMRRTETMGAYKPSTLLDWEAGRALEIEAIWGEPLRRARAAGGQTPRLEIVYALLKALDAKPRISL